MVELAYVKPARPLLAAGDPYRGRGGQGEEGEERGLTDISLFHHCDPGDGIPPDRILDIFDLHFVADQRRS